MLAGMCQKKLVNRLKVSLPDGPGGGDEGVAWGVQTNGLEDCVAVLAALQKRGTVKTRGVAPDLVLGAQILHEGADGSQGIVLVKSSSEVRSAADLSGFA